MPNFPITYHRFGNAAILMDWPAKIDEHILTDILIFKQKLKRHELPQMIQSSIHAYHSLLINFGKPIENFAEIVSILKQCYTDESDIEEQNSVTWKIPVCYEEPFGWDLEDMSKNINLSMEEIVSIHSQADYLLYFLGFLPGFMYLGGLDERLHIARMETPRLKVPKGSVAIGFAQTGIYPHESPGGWHIIGNSPINFFDLDMEIPCFAKPGNRITFETISFEEHQHLENLISQGKFEPKSLLT